MKQIFKEITEPKKFIRHLYVAVTYRLVRVIDGWRDRRICGRSLTKQYKTNIKGGNAYSGTCYWTLEKVFADSTFTESDSLVDIGCGQGRLFAFMIERQFPGRMTGIEYHAATAAIARQWTARYPKKDIRIIEGDVFAQDYDEYNVFYCFNSLAPAYFQKLLELLERQLTHPIRLYFMSDQLCWRILKDRPGWTMQFRRTCWKKYGLCMWGATQYYSLWEYCPQKILSENAAPHSYL